MNYHDEKVVKVDHLHWMDGSKKWLGLFQEPARSSDPGVKEWEVSEAHEKWLFSMYTKERENILESNKGMYESVCVYSWNPQIISPTAPWVAALIFCLYSGCSCRQLFQIPLCSPSPDQIPQPPDLPALCPGSLGKMIGSQFDSWSVFCSSSWQSCPLHVNIWELS